MTFSVAPDPKPRAPDSVTVHARPQLRGLATGISPTPHAQEYDTNRADRAAAAVFEKSFHTFRGAVLPADNARGQVATDRHSERRLQPQPDLSWSFPKIEAKRRI